MKMPPKEVLEQYRQKLAVELTKYDRSQSALARHIGIDQSAVSRMLSGGRRIRLEEQGLIEEYLRRTDPNPQFKRMDRLPAETNVANDALSAFPELDRFISKQLPSTPETIKFLLDADSDYPLVATTASSLEIHVNQVFGQLVEAQSADLDDFGDGLRDNLVRKVEAIAAAGRLSDRHSATLLAALAIRDAFAHSPTPLRLLDPEVFAVAEQVIAPSYFDSVKNGPADPKSIRMHYLLGVISLTHLLVVNDPEKTVQLFLDAATKAISAPDPS